MSDLATYYDESYPPSLFVPPVPATGATAGAPGAWTPSGSQPPATFADLANGTPNAVVASPLTPWTAGQYVQTRTAGGAGWGHWSGTQWESGAALVLGADPRSSTIAQVEAYVEALGDESDPDVIAETQRVLDTERAGQARSTLIAWLDQRDGVT